MSARDWIDDRKPLNVPSLIWAIEEMERIMEAQKRGLKHKRHAPHIAKGRAKVEAVMRSFWKRQEAALLAEIGPRLEHLLAAHPAPVKEAMPYDSQLSRGNVALAGVPLRESRTPAAKNFASSLLPTSLQPLRFPVTKGESDEYYTAIQDAITGAAGVLTEELAAGEHSASDFAGRYLRDNSLSKLTGGINETSTQRLRDAVADAWQDGGSYDQIVGAIKDTFADFSDTRAGLIAQTEVADAYNSSRSDTAAALGYDEKSWETESDDPCQVCLDNEAQGWIDADDSFNSGDDEPTAHTKCLCTVNFRRAPGGE